jgi:hypothetical protein
VTPGRSIDARINPVDFDNGHGHYMHEHKNFYSCTAQALYITYTHPNGRLCLHSISITTRWGMAVTFISVPAFRVRPPGHFIHISITTLIVSALKNYHAWSFLEVLTGILNHFWNQVAVSLLNPPHGGFRSEARSGRCETYTKPFRN